MSDWSIQIDDDFQRPGQIYVVESFTKWIRSGCENNQFSIYMACRYGKSDVIRSATVLAIGEGIASAGLIIHPNINLAGQFLETSRVRDWQERWQPRGDRQRLSKSAILRDFGRGTMCNGEWIGSIHIQCLMQQVQRLAATHWIDYMRHQYGAPPMIVVDETQYYSLDNKWGDVPRAFNAAGCPLIVCTGTPFRTDKADLVGFSRKAITDEGTRKVVYITPHKSDPTKVIRNEDIRQYTEFEVKADAEVPYQQAWGEGVIAKATLIPIDWNCVGYGARHGDERKLSELSEMDAYELLPQLVRDPKLIAEFARETKTQIDRYRSSGVDATAIIYTMDDRKGCADNEHAKMFKEELERVEPSVRVRIATLKDDEPAKTIEDFCHPKKNLIDVLCVKQMGSDGIDGDRICIVVLLHTTRALPRLTQQCLRGGNRALKDHFVVIAPADKMMKKAWDKIITESGGEYVESETLEHTEEPIDKEEKAESGYLGVDVSESDVIDHDGAIATFEELALVFTMLIEIPDMQRRHTYPQIAAIAKRLGVPVKPFEKLVEIMDQEDLCDRQRPLLNKLRDGIAKWLFRKKEGRPFNGATEHARKIYGLLKREAALSIRSRAGIHKSWDKTNKDRSHDPMDYRAWIAAAEKILGEFRADSETS